MGLSSASRQMMRGVINTASKVMSAPHRAYYGLKKSRAESEAKVLREAKMYDNAPNFDEKGNPTNAYKARFMAKMIKDKYKKKKK